MIEKIIKYLLFALSFTPIIITNFIYQGSNIGKIFWASLIIFLIDIFFIVYILYQKKFIDNVIKKIGNIYKSPIFLSLVLFLFSILLSSIFAFDKFSAFFGDIERAEGFIGIFILAQVFILTLLFFEKKDWLNFFKFNLFTTFILVGKSLFDFLHGVSRPDSFIGNPSFLSGYLIFSIFCSLYVIWESKNKFWQYCSIVSSIASIVGIFLSQTRGTILGVFLALVVVLIFTAIKGRNIFYKKINLQKFSIIFLVGLIVFSGIFLITKKNNFWQKIPGFARVAQISKTDVTTNTRLLNMKTSLRAMDPKVNGYKKLLIGWGQDNFIIAYFKNFDSKQLDYEGGDFDRSHNKILDVFVMNGLFGLLAYLSIFFFLFRYVFISKDRLFLKALLLFWVTAYLIHLLFLFDQIGTHIAFFIILAFILYRDKLQNKEILIDKISKNKMIFSEIILLIICIFDIYIFITNYIPSYFQLHKFNYLTNGQYEKAFKNPDKLFYPYTFAQPTIRRDFLKAVDLSYVENNPDSEKLIKIGFLKGEEYLNKNPWDLRFVSYLATAYTNVGNLSKNNIYINKGKEYFNRLIDFSPEKPDYNLGMGLSLYNENNYHEALKYFEKAFDLDHKLYSLDKKAIEKIYIQFYVAFYKEKNLEDFKKVSTRLKMNDYKNSELLDQILEFIEKNNRWPNIIFK